MDQDSSSVKEVVQGEGSRLLKGEVMKRTLVSVTIVATTFAGIIVPTAAAQEGGSSAGKKESTTVEGSSQSGSSLIDGNLNGSSQLGQALSSNPQGVKEVGNIMSDDRSVQALSVASLL